MNFPAPDVGVARFPGPDTGVAGFPGPDTGSAAFPPAPTPVIFINGETVIDILSEGVTIGVPWNVFDTVVDIHSAAIAVASVEVLAATTVDILSAVQQIFDVVTSETVIDISSTVVVVPSPTTVLDTSIEITSVAILGAPSASVLTETLVDITSDVISIPVTSFIGTTTVDIASTATAIPVGVINSNTSIDIASTGLITNFSQVSMTKNGDEQLAASTWAEIGPWTAGSNSTVTGNALRVNGSGNATIQVGSEWPTSTSVKDWRVLKNGTVVWTKGSGTGLTLADTFALAVVDGDLLTCEGWNSSGVTANRIVKTGANTYLRVVPA